MAPAESVVVPVVPIVPVVPVPPIAPAPPIAVSVMVEVAALLSAALLSLVLHAAVATTAPSAANERKDRIFIWWLALRL